MTKIWYAGDEWRELRFDDLVSVFFLRSFPTFWLAQTWGDLFLFYSVLDEGVRRPLASKFRSRWQSPCTFESNKTEVSSGWKDVIASRPAPSQRRGGRCIGPYLWFSMSPSGNAGHKRRKIHLSPVPCWAGCRYGRAQTCIEKVADELVGELIERQNKIEVGARCWNQSWVHSPRLAEKIHHIKTSLC